MLGYGTSQKTYRLWNIDANKLVIGRHVIFDERSILNKAKIIEVPDSEAANETIVGNEIDNDDTLVNDTETAHEYFTDAENTLFGHSADTDSTDDNKETIHGTNGNGIANIEFYRSDRVRWPVSRYG